MSSDSKLQKLGLSEKDSLEQAILKPNRHFMTWFIEDLSNAIFGRDIKPELLR